MTFSLIPQSLRMQLIIALGATTLVFMSILTLLSYRTAAHTHEKLALERLSMEVAEHGASLERLLRHQTQVLEYVASMLSNELASDAGEEQLREVLSPWTMAGSGYRQLDMMDAESGQIVASTNRRDEGKFREDRAYFKQGQSASVLQRPYFSRARRQIELTAATPVPGQGNTITAAVLAGHLNVDAILQILTPAVDVPGSARTELVGVSGLLLTGPHATGPWRAPSLDALKHCLAGKQGTSVESAFGHEPALLAFTYLPGRELCLIAHRSRDETLAPAREFGLHLLIAATLCALVVIGLAVAIAARVSRPLEELTSRLRAFSESRREAPATRLEGGREVQELANGLQEMMSDLSRQHALTEKRFFDALDTVPDGFAWFDAEDRMVVCNDTWRYDFNGPIQAIVIPGISFEEIVRANLEAQQISDAIGDEETWLSQRMDQHRRGGSMLFQMRTERWIEIKERRGDDGSTIIVYTDVSELRKSERQLRQFEHMAASVSDLMVIADLKLTIQAANDAYARYHGLDRDRVIGMTVQEVLGAEQFEMFYHGRRTSVLEGNRETVRDWVEFAGVGRRWMNIEYSPFFGDDGSVQGWVSIARDETAMQETEQARRDLEEQLRQAHKMEAVGHLTGGIAHDFNNILAAVLGFSHLARTAIDQGRIGKLPGYIEQIESSGNRARELVAQLLAFSRDEPEELEVIQLAPVLERAMMMLRATLPRSIDVSTDIAPSISNLQAEPVQIEQVLLNLCINARDGMHARGSLLVSARENFMEHATCMSCRMWFSGHMVEISVKDDGDGIPDAILQNAFDPFFTTKSAGEGTGMGLAIVHGIVHRHGGHILVETRQGHGTEVRCFIPVAGAEVTTAAISEQSAKRSFSGRYKIVVIDDETPIVDYVSELLESEGHEVVGFSDAVAGFEYVRDHLDEVDLLVTDQTMPVLTGIEIARLVREKRDDLPVVICTGYSNAISDETIAGLGHLHLHVLQKPVKADELLEVVGRATGA